MSRALLLILALAAAAYADPYSYNQVSEIIFRVEVCLEPVDFAARNQCTNEAEWSLSDGNTKESLATSVSDCLTKQAVNATIVATAQDCLTESLAQDLLPPLDQVASTARKH